MNIKDLKVPGVVWVIMLLLLGIGLQAGSFWIEQNLGVHSLVVGAVVAAIFVAAKSIAPGTSELNRAIDIIERLLSQKSSSPSTEMRGVSESVPSLLEPVPQRPNRLARILWG